MEKKGGRIKRGGNSPSFASGFLGFGGKKSYWLVRIRICLFICLSGLRASMTFSEKMDSLYETQKNKRIFLIRLEKENSFRIFVFRLTG